MSVRNGGGGGSRPSPLPPTTSPSVSHCERTLPFRTNDPVTALPRWSEGATRPSRFLENRMHSWGVFSLNLHHPLGASCGIVPSFTLSLYCWFGTVYISWAACHATCPGSRGLVQNAHYHPPTSSSFDVLHTGLKGCGLGSSATAPI